MTDIDKTEAIKRVLKLQKRLLKILRDNEEPAPWLELNLTIAQLKSLFFIRAKGATNAKSLAAVMKVTPPDVTRIVDRLVEQGLVSREENPENRRMQILKITEKGEALLGGLREHGPHRIGSILPLLNSADLAAAEQGLAALLRAAEGQQNQPGK